MNDNFEYKNLLEQLKMSLDDLNSYYRSKRRYEYDNNIPLRDSNINKKLHGIMKICLRIDRLITGRKLHIFDDKRVNTSSSKIYAASHVGRYDIESTMEAIDDQAFFVMGDPGETYRNFEGLFLNMWGRIETDTGYQVFDDRLKLKNGEYISDDRKKLIDEYKKDRHICYETCVKHLNNHDNILIYPEGAWNITPKIMQPLFDGTSSMAIETNSNIIPIGIIRDSKDYIVNIGSNMDVSGATLKDTKDITEELKEKMSALKWEIIESRPMVSRSSFKSPRENEIDFKSDILSESTNGYDEDVIVKSRYLDINSPEYVKSTLSKIK